MDKGHFLLVLKKADLGKAKGCYTNTVVDVSH